MIAIIQSLLIIFAAFARLRLALYTFVFFLPFMPRYLAIAIGDGGGALSARRISLIFLVFVFFLWVLYERGKAIWLLKLIRSVLFAFMVVGVVVFAKTTATLIAFGLGPSLIYVIDDFLVAVPVMLLVMMVVRGIQDMRQIFLLMVFGLFLSEIFALIEYIKQSPLLADFVRIDVQVDEKLVEGRFRDGAYRAAALFDNPLLLSEFVCIAWSFAWYLSLRARSFIERGIAIISLVLAPVTLYLVASRSGWLIFGIGILLLLGINIWRKGGRLVKPFIFLFAVTGLIAMIIISVDVFNSPEIYFDRGDDSTVSALERINQYYVVAQAFQQRPWLGYGMQQNIAQDLDFLNHLDNYWLRLVLEGGVIAVTAFSLFVVIVIKWAFEWTKTSVNRDESWLAIAIVVSVASFALYKLFLSIPWNNIYFFIIAGMLVVRKGTAQFQRVKHA